MPDSVSALAGDLYYASSVGEITDWSCLVRHVNPEWIEEALSCTGTASVRKRRLPAELVVWVVVGMAIARSKPIVDVVEHLDLALPSSTASVRVAKSAVSKARAKLGEAPLRWLFDKTASAWCDARLERDSWRGLSLFGVDGTTLRVADSDVNREAFGLASGGDRGPSGYPLIRLASLIALRSHLIRACEFGPYGNSELHYAQALWAHVPERSVVIVDRGFAYPGVLLPLGDAEAEKHWLTRVRAEV